MASISDSVSVSLSVSISSHWSGPPPCRATSEMVKIPSSSCPFCLPALAFAHAHSSDLFVWDRDGRIEKRTLSALGDDGGAMGEEGMWSQSSFLSLLDDAYVRRFVFRGVRGGRWIVVTVGPAGFSWRPAIRSREIVGWSRRAFLGGVDTERVDWERRSLEPKWDSSLHTNDFFFDVCRLFWNQLVTVLSCLKTHYGVSGRLDN